MADRLTRVFGTEEDRVNCPFFYKMGACRHGDRCSRLHHKPLFSPTILLPHMYQNPRVILTHANGPHGQMPQQLDMAKVQEAFEDFYEEVFEELAQYGEIEAMNVCDNLGDHLVGNVYVKFVDEEGAQAALQKMNGRFYAGRMLTCEFSPVSDFREARCRQFDEGNCKRGDQCNFMHLMRVPSSLRRDLFEHQPHRSREGRRKYEEDERRDRGRYDQRDRRGGGYGGYGGGGGGRYGGDRRRGGYDDRRRDNRDHRPREDRDHRRRDDRDHRRSDRDRDERKEDRGRDRDRKRSRSRSPTRRRRDRDEKRRGSRSRSKSKSKSRSKRDKARSKSRSRSRHRSGSRSRSRHRSKSHSAERPAAPAAAAPAAPPAAE